MSTVESQKRILRPHQVRGANRAAVLQLLRHHDHMSRADIARQSGLSEGTVSRIMGELIDDSLVWEDGAENSTGGRPGRRLQLEPKRFAFGAEIQNWETRVAVSTMRGQIVESRRFRTPASPLEALDEISAAFVDFRSRLGTQRVPGIGISARGIVKSDSGLLVLGTRPGWANVPVRDVLEKELREPVYLENNVRAAALAEYYYGSSEVAGSRAFLFVKVDEGVGMGIILEGKLHYGPRMAAGEFGEMVIAMSRAEERNERPGTLESLASNPALCDRHAEMAGERRSVSGDTFARVRRIVQALEDGEEAARASLVETARCLGIGIANVVWGLDIDVVVIDGAITGAWHLIEPVIRQELPETKELAELSVLLRPSALGGDAALIGAATMPFAPVFATGGSVELEEADA